MGMFVKLVDLQLQHGALISFHDSANYGCSISGCQRSSLTLAL